MRTFLPVAGPSRRTCGSSVRCGAQDQDACLRSLRLASPELASSVAEPKRDALRDELRSRYQQSFTFGMLHARLLVFLTYARTPRRTCGEKHGASCVIWFLLIVIPLMVGEAPEEALKDALAQADAKWLLLQTEAGQHCMRQRCAALPTCRQMPPRQTATRPWSGSHPRQRNQVRGQTRSKESRRAQIAWQRTAQISRTGRPPGLSRA